jgi:hypothetical protein
MDNDYASVAATFGTAAYGSAIANPLGFPNPQYNAAAVTTTTMGFGTGHTLGYKGKAPADISPAFQQTEGLACFDCHSPHGNSSRIISAFGSPSHPAGDGYVKSLVGVSFMATQFYRIQEQMKVEFDFNDFISFIDDNQPGTGIVAAGWIPDGSYQLVPEDLSTMMFDFDGRAPVKWTGATPMEIGGLVNAGTGTIGGELGQLQTAFGAWMYGADMAPGGSGANADMMPKAPLPSDMFTWRTTGANFSGDANGNGYADVSTQGAMALMVLFTDNWTDMDLVNLFIQWKVYWGQDVDAGNIATAFLNMGDFQVQGAGYGPIANPEVEVWHKPLFPKGRFLLLKNPDSKDDFQKSMVTGDGLNEFDGMALQMGMPLSAIKGSPDMSINMATGAPDSPTGKRASIDWEWPLGPAATWGPFFYTDTNERFPLAFPWAPRGVAMENEVCTSCHDGAAGQSTQAASVWKPNASDSTTGAYITAYTHDANPRGCARAQWLNAEDGDNFGPHCANCHTGGSSCQACHSESGDNWDSFGRDAYDAFNYTTGSYAETSSLFVEGESSYRGPASVRTSAIVAVNGQCLDGGFSYPHRTMGANMLKDAMYGVDFNGDKIAAGFTRTVPAAFGGSYLTDFFDGGTSFESTKSIAGQRAQNLDSVCLDCHGNATYWNGDAVKATFVSGNPLDDPADGMQMWDINAWSLLLKGLP